MTAELKTAMDKAELKKLLAKSKQEPVNCAIAQGDGKTSAPGLLLLDKVKAPKAVLKDLTKEFPDAKNERFGTAFVDPDADASLVNFRINKAASGLGKLLVKALKGTGFKKVRLDFEDGSATESVADEDEEGQPQQAQPVRDRQAPQQQGGAPQQAQGAAPPPPPPPPQPPAAGQGAADGQDLKALTDRLVGLAKRIQSTVDPNQKGTLAGLATQAQAALRGRDLATAKTHIDNLGRLLDRGQTGVSGAAANNPARAAPAAPGANGQAAAGPNGASAVVIAKSRLAWVAARQKVEGEIGKLHSAIGVVYKDHGAAEHLDKAFKSRVEGMLNTLDHSLAEKLDQVNQAADPGQRAKLVGEAQQIMKRYEDYLSSEPLIAKMDSNPFAPVAVHKTLTATLAALSKSVR